MCPDAELEAILHANSPFNFTHCNVRIQVKSSGVENRSVLDFIGFRYHRDFSVKKKIFVLHLHDNGKD